VVLVQAAAAGDDEERGEEFDGNPELQEAIVASLEVSGTLTLRVSNAMVGHTSTSEMAALCLSGCSSMHLR
jgi:hypothetical protein